MKDVDRGSVTWSTRCTGRRIFLVVYFTGGREIYVTCGGGSVSKDVCGKADLS